MCDDNEPVSKVQVAEVNGYKIFKHGYEVFNGIQYKYLGEKRFSDGNFDIFETYTLEHAMEFAAQGGNLPFKE